MLRYISVDFTEEYKEQQKVALPTKDVYVYTLAVMLVVTLVKQLHAKSLGSDWSCHPSDMQSRDIQLPISFHGLVDGLSLYQLIKVIQ